MVLLEDKSSSTDARTKNGGCCGSCADAVEREVDGESSPAAEARDWGWILRSFRTLNVFNF